MIRGYRYGFNGMEKDDNIKGEGNSYTTEFRQYDPRVGRWLSVDPLFTNFPWQSPYVAFDNNPIYYIDPKGLAAESPPTEYRGEDGMLLLKTDDGSDDVITVPKDREQEFVDNTPNPSGNAEQYAQPGFNNFWRTEFGGQELPTPPASVIDTYNNLTDDTGAFSEFLETPTVNNYMIFAGKRLFSELTNPSNYLSPMGPVKVKLKAIPTKSFKSFVDSKSWPKVQGSGMHNKVKSKAYKAYSNDVKLQNENIKQLAPIIEKSINTTLGLPRTYSPEDFR